GSCQQPDSHRTHDGYQRYERIAQTMFKNDNVLGDAFGPRCHNKIRSEHFKHFRSNKTRGGRHWENHQCNSWQDGILKTFPKGNGKPAEIRSEEHTSELQSRFDLVCRLLLEKKKTK